MGLKVFLRRGSITNLLGFLQHLIVVEDILGLRPSAVNDDKAVALA